jgi:hypothetical protein
MTTYQEVVTEVRLAGGVVVVTTDPRRRSGPSVRARAQADRRHQRRSRSASTAASLMQGSFVAVSWVSRRLRQLPEVMHGCCSPCR